MTKNLKLIQRLELDLAQYDKSQKPLCGLKLIFLKKRQTLFCESSTNGNNNQTMPVNTNSNDDLNNSAEAYTN